VSGYLSARVTLGALALLGGASILFGLGSGAMTIAPSEVLVSLAGLFDLSGPSVDADSGPSLVVLQIRLPRVLAGVLVGAALAVCGAALQGLFRNPLADPGLIGVSAGAALGAMTLIVLGPVIVASLSWPAPWLPIAEGSEQRWLPMAAFAGALGASWIVHRFAARDGQTSTATLLLAGIAIAATAQAGTGFLTYLADDVQLRTLTFWSLGSLGAATWPRLAIVAPLLGIGILVVIVHARALDAMLLGDSEALHLGHDVERVKRRLLVTVAVVVGAAVSISGIIGFVGLVVPHLVRLLAGPGHRLLLPASALLGATLLVGADVLARTLVAPAELPIGVITALFGGPFFLWLLMRDRRRGALTP